MLAADALTCPSCGNYDSMVPAGKPGRHVDAPDGRRFEVRMYRCLACGVEEVARRTWREAHKDDQPSPSGALASDGLLFVARPTEEAVE